MLEIFMNKLQRYVEKTVNGEVRIHHHPNTDKMYIDIRNVGVVKFVLLDNVTYQVLQGLTAEQAAAKVTEDYKQQILKCFMK